MIRARIRALCVLLVGMTSSPAALADVLIDQPVDHVSFFSSFLWGGAEGLQAGDDLVLAEGHTVRIDRVSFGMVVTWPNRPEDYSLKVYRTIDADYWEWGWSPLYQPPDHQVIGASDVVDHGEWTGGGWYNGSFDLHEMEVVFDDLNIVLSADDTLGGRWFLSPEGLLDNYPFQRSFWATSGDGALNWSEAWFKTVPFGWPGWVPIGNLPNWEWGPTDFAMRIEGEVIPVPGALTALGVLFGVMRRRRR